MGYSAESYETYLAPTLFAPWASYLVRAAQAQPGERVLDVACGTGIVARRIAPRVESQGKVIGLDRDPNMLRVARLAAEREGLAIDWCLGQAERLPFPEGNFDLIVCQFGLMLFPDQLTALREMHRVLKTGGRVALSVWQGLDRHPFYQALHETSQRHLGKSGVQQAFSLGDATELRRLLTDAGFQNLTIAARSLTVRFPHPDEFLAWELEVDPAATPALQHLDARAQQATLAALRHEMQTPLDQVLQGNQVVLQFHAHIAHARCSRASSPSVEDS